ncbi:MAG: Ig-like domain-containing protein [Prevotellaceae bacterium]|jgi:hypothetical protein|nr:Ig-like domain-containing protein [Prevotellaceae bacterium]
MRTFTKFKLAIALCASIAVAGCDDKKSEPAIPRLSPEIVSVAEGSSVNVAISGGAEPFTVKSSAEAKATARIEGRAVSVTGVAEGTATVTVTGKDGGAAQLPVAVTRRQLNSPVLSSVAVDVEVGGTVTVSIVDSTGVPEFTATSSNSSVVSVSLTGRTVALTGKSAGGATVTVKGADNAEATVAVTVNDEQILFGANKKQIGDGSKRFFINKSHTIAKGVYTMVGWIYVEDGATLTIEPGTVIKGTDFNHDGRQSATGSSLVIKRGAKIMAQGTASEPIVFTSAKPKGERQATDWGGIIICGKAKNNMNEMTVEGGIEADHGGNDDNDNSGILRYVRIEFGGYPYATDNEINGLTLGSVGRGTQIDHIQVSYSGDDSFEWFGGTVNCKHLVAYHGWDDDFDTDNGFSGKLQFLLGVRDPKIADQSNSNGFESDNNANGADQQPFTSCIFSNVTVIGPMEQDPSFQNTAGSAGYISGYSWGNTTGAASPIRTGIFQAAMQIRRSSRLSCFNSVFAGFPVGIMISNEKGTSQQWAEQNMLKIKNVVFAGMGKTGADADKKDPSQWSGTFSSDFFSKAELNNRYLPATGDLKLQRPTSKKIPLSFNSKGFADDDATANYAPATGSPLLNAADFSDAFLSDAFFEKVSYIGAFKSPADADNWTKGWCNWDPQNTDY